MQLEFKSGHSFSSRAYFTAQKVKSPLRISSVNVTKPYLATFTEEIINAELYFPRNPSSKTLFEDRSQKVTGTIYWLTFNFQ